MTEYNSSVISSLFVSVFSIIQEQAQDILSKGILLQQARCKEGMRERTVLLLPV